MASAGVLLAALALHAPGPYRRAPAPGVRVPRRARPPRRRPQNFSPHRAPRRVTHARAHERSSGDMSLMRLGRSERFAAGCSQLGAFTARFPPT